MGKVAGVCIAVLIPLIGAAGISCGGGNVAPGQAETASPTEDQHAGIGQPDGWLSFPPAIDGNYSRYRFTSESERTVEGTDYAEVHGDDNYEIPATEDYVIVSGSTDPLAWAVYNLPELDTDRPTKLQINIAEAGVSPGADPLPLSCWLGVTDYTTYSWAWYGPFVQPTTLVLNSPNRRDRYVSAAHSMSFALLTVSSSRFAGGDNPAGRTAALIDCSVIATLPADDEDYLVTKPHFAQITDVDFGADGKGASQLESWQYVNLYWDHVVDSANPNCEAQQYYVYRRGPDDESRQLIGSVDAPAEQYTDPTDNDSGIGEPVPGVTYTYSLRAGNTVGYTSYDSVPVTIPLEQPTPDIIVITAYAIRVDNAANGIGFDPEVFDADNEAGTIDANSATNLSLEWIAGTFNGLPFSGEDEAGWPQDMTQDDYDVAFGAARDNLEWHISHGGESEFRRTSNWLVLAGGAFPVTGDPGDGIVFPDDDPESIGVDSEGALGMQLPDDVSASYPANEDLTVKVPSAVFLDLTMDIGFDPVAPLLLDYLDSEGEPLSRLSLFEDTLVQIPFEWGVNGEPAELSSTSLELRKCEAGTCYEVAVDFAYNALGADPGEFTYLDEGGDSRILCNIPGSQLASGSLYACRLSEGTVWSSINKPGRMLYVPLGLHQELVTVPEHCWSEVDCLQIYFADPVVRTGFNDGKALKINGEEFTVETVESEMFPRVIVAETINPDTIEFDDANIPGVFTAERAKGRLVIDIAVLSIPGSPGDPLRDYSYRVFDSAGFVVGQGYFDISPIGSFLTPPSGVDWGVNVWDYEQREIGERDYSNKVVDGSTIGTDEPDILWFELNSGWFFDYEQNEKGVYAAFPPDVNNLLIRVQDADSGDFMYVEGALRIAGLGASGSYILIHTVTNLDWRWPGVPGWPGRLSPGQSYNLSLDDSHFPGLEYTFEDQLVTIGTNPNT